MYNTATRCTRVPKPVVLHRAPTLTVTTPLHFVAVDHEMHEYAAPCKKMTLRLAVLLAIAVPTVAAEDAAHAAVDHSTKTLARLYTVIRNALPDSFTDIS